MRTSCVLATLGRGDAGSGPARTAACFTYPPNVVAAENFAAITTPIDKWFEAWVETDAEKRRALLEACTTEDVCMRDAYSSLTGRDELDQHIAICHLHMPGAISQRTGDPKQCQGTALVAWQVTAPDGKPQGAGTNVVCFAPDGKIAAVTGFW